MTVRTFKQHGQGYSTSAITAKVTFNGNEIFNGPVDTVQNESPDMSNLPWPGPLLCTWTDDLDFAGSKSMKIEVSGESSGFLLLMSTLANYVFVVESLDPYKVVPGGPAVYNGFYSQKLDGFDAHDPYTDVMIDGVAQLDEHTPECNGQWSWMIPVGSTFTATLNISKGHKADAK